MHEQYPPRPEQSLENDLFHDRLQHVQAEAMQGRVPTKFMAALEIEMYIAAHAETGERIAHTPFFSSLLQRGPQDEPAREWCEKYSFVQPDQEMLQIQLFPEEQDDYEARIRDEARAYVAALPAATAEEAAKREEWLANIDTFTTSDLINFKIYQEFSQPTLGKTAPPVGGSYREMEVDGDRKGWLEFRFGNGTLQSGYYDNPTVTEMRLTPCPPEVLVEREEIIRKRVLALTTQFNGMVLDGGTHINLSAYQYDARTMEWEPVINQAHPGKMLDAVSGLSAAIEDGATLTEKLADRRSFYGPTGGMRSWEVSPYRDSIRVKEDYVELRDASMKATTAHGLLWMMAGMMEGFESGSQALQERGHHVATFVSRLVPETTHRYDKRYDLQLLRAIEQSKATDHVIEVDASHARQRGGKMVESWIGWRVPRESTASMISTWLIRATQYNAEGRLSVDPTAPDILEAMLALVEQFAPVDEVRGDIEKIGVDTMLGAYGAFLAHDAIRVRQMRSVHANPQMSPRNRAAWEARWIQSPVMRRAYGARLHELMAIVGPVIDRNQAPADLTDDLGDPENFQRLMQHYLSSDT